MKKRFSLLLTIVLLVFGSSISGKPTFKNSNEVYQYWAKRGIIEMVYAYMQDFWAVDSIKYSKEKESAHNYYKIYIKGFDTINVKDLDNNFETIEQFLISNNWKSTKYKLLDTLIERYDQKDSLNEKFFSLTTAFDNYKCWNEKKKEILAHYNVDLQSINNKPVTIDTTQELVLNNVSKDNIKDQTNYNSIIISLLAGILFGAFVIYFFSRWKIYSILSKEKNYYSNLLEEGWRKKYLFKYIGIFAVLKKRKDDKNQINNNLNEKIRQLHEQLERLKDRIDLTESQKIIKSETIESVEEESPANVIELKVEPEENTLNEIYFTIPENDGSFKAINAKRNKEVESYYKIEIGNNQTGKLHFISGEYDLRALDNIDYYLNPVCEIDNITERTHARKIIMLIPGTVFLSGDCWKIDVNNKVKIKLI